MVRRSSSGAVALGAAICALAAAAPARADSDRPQIDGAKGFQCLTDAKGRNFRVQCAPDDAPPDKRICIFAPDSERDGDGNWVRPLERASPCYPSGPFDITMYESKGFKMVEGVADSPYGWYRWSDGAVSQINFDLHKRLYIGGSWAPIFTSGDQTHPEEAGNGRVGVDFGLLEYQYYTGGLGKTKMRHRVSLMEGHMDLAPFGARIRALHYDLSVRYATPLLRIVTFFGKPRRYDGRLNLGAWFEGGDLEVHQAPAAGGAGIEAENLWRFATAMATADIWQSDDLYSFVRLRAGLGLERTYTDNGPERDALTPAAAIDADFTLDAEGRHHLTGLVEYEAPIYNDTYPLVGDRAQRRRVEAAYEWLFTTANDQPFTLRIAGGTAWRDDIPGAIPQWATYANIGLRFSLWAPPRRKP
jgi:hypothetical protein